MSLTQSISNYDAEQTRLVCGKERKLKERQILSLSAAPAFPLKDHWNTLKPSRVHLFTLFAAGLQKFLLTSNNKSLILTLLFVCFLSNKNENKLKNMS